MKQRIIFLLCLVTFINSSLSAQDYYFKQYQVENGLSNNNVTSSIQDTHGFMWIGTRDGLNRFDGYTFRVFRDTDEGAKSIGNNWITSLALDNKGCLWVGTFMGIYKYNEKEENFSLIPFCKGMRAKNLSFDSSGNLWLILDGKLVKYNEQLDSHQTYTIPDNGFLNSFCYTSTEKIWLVLSNGMLYQFDITSGEFQGNDLFSHSPGYKVKNLTSVYPSISGEKLFIGSLTHGAKLFDIRTSSYKDLMSKEIEQGEICVTDFVQIAPGEVWIASESGLYIYNLGKDSYTLINKRMLDPYSLSTNLLHTLFKDKENGIWLGSYSGGINYYAPFQPFQKFYAYPKENSLEGDIVHDITTDRYDNLWIATEDAGLNKLDALTGKYSHYKTQTGMNSLPHQNLHGLVADGDNLWVGSLMGIDLINIPNGRVIKHYSINQNKSVVIMKKIPNGMILVGTSNGMYVYNKVSDQFESIPQFPDNIKIQSIIEDHEGIIWAGTFNKGLYYFNPHDGKNGKFQHDTIPTNNSNTINDIFEDHDNNLWFATQEGLKKYDRQTGKVTRYTVKNGMPGNITFRILSDESKNLWVSTTNGLVWLNPQTSEIKVYKKEHGLITNQFNYNSSWKDKNGKMYFGMVKGMIGFYPKEIGNFENEIQVYLTNMTVLDNTFNAKRTTIPISFASHITLKNSQSTFSIDFSSLTFVVPSMNEYAFCMEGLDKNWTYLNDSHTAYFTKLPPGNYVFKVKKSNLTGAGNESPVELKITVLAPWWLSYVAMLFYFVLFIGITVLIIKRAKKQNQKKIDQSIKQLEYKKEKELYQAKINFFINVAHEIRTPLTLITGPLDKVINNNKLPEDTQNYLSIMDKNAKQLLKLVDQLLDFRKTELQGYSLNYEKRDIVAILYENFNRFKDAAKQNKLSFNVSTNTKKLDISVDEEALVKILSNLLLNAIKYARTQILVTFTYNECDDYFAIDVINDGQPIQKAIREKIFEPFFRGENAEFKPGTGLGLPLARSLAEMHSGTLTLLDSETELITFRLRLPVNLADSINLRDDAKDGIDTDSTIQTEYTFDISKPTILIVEDNEEMKNFIGHEINSVYNVLTAVNGEKAMSILYEFSVQLIVSDVMMPVMDGFSLLKKVKTDLDYSHVPVILLTAKNTLQSRLEGLELGADAYIEKPFTVDILLAQITNLLNNRNSIRSYYFNSPIANLNSMAHTKADEIFLESLNEIIIENIANTNFDVEMIAEQMHMSRPTLYRKIKAISNLAPNELIRICRLKKAAELIIHGKLSLCEISEKVGFSSQSYFSRSFSKQFEISPSDYANSNKKHRN
jgi:signal transduction histidine kinase/ligand-binding sensor domain-containing protein/DNA-binding response OmpR family regulator